MTTVKSQHKPTNDSRDQVEFLVMCGEPRTDICIQLGISMRDLEAHYSDELLIGRVKQRHKLLFLMREKAQDRSLPAIKELLELHDRGLMVQRPAPGADTEEAVRGPKLGKKEAADEAARNPDEGSAMGALLARRLDGGDGRPN